MRNGPRSRRHETFEAIPASLPPSLSPSLPPSRPAHSVVPDRDLGLLHVESELRRGLRSHRRGRFEAVQELHDVPNGPLPPDQAFPRGDLAPGREGGGGEGGREEGREGGREGGRIRELWVALERFLPFFSFPSLPPSLSPSLPPSLPLSFLPSLPFALPTCSCRRRLAIRPSERS
jgi:hypothetical protein